MEHITHAAGSLNDTWPRVKFGTNLAGYRRRGCLDGLPQQQVISAEHREPVIHFLSVCFVGPMPEKGSILAQRHLLADGMDFKGEGAAPWAHQFDRPGHEL